MVNRWIMANWGFLTSYARVLMCIAHDPGTRLRDIAARLDITEAAPTASSPT
jgi:putative heme degradation protein